MKQQSHPGAVRRIGEGFLAALANCVVFLVAFFVGLRAIYPLVFSAARIGELGSGVHSLVSARQSMLVSIVLAFVAAAVLAAVWTRNVVNVIVTSAAMFLVGTIAVAEAIYLTDRGDPAIMWGYIRPGPAEFLQAAIASGAAALGWVAFGLFLRLRHGGVRAKSAAEQADAADGRRDG